MVCSDPSSSWLPVKERINIGGEDNDRDEQIDETLDKPRDPIHWCAQTHHLHGFL